MTPRCPVPRDRHTSIDGANIICSSCRSHLARALRELPELYVRLLLAYEPGVGWAAHTERGLPVTTEPDIAMRRCLDVLRCWHEVVATACDLTQLDDYRWPPTDNSSRADGRIITTAAAVLGAHLDDLATLDTTTVLRRRTVEELTQLPDDALGHGLASGEWNQRLDMDGPLAVAEIIDLYGSIRSLLGDTRGARVLSTPCPTDGCGLAMLVAWDGSDTIICEGCGAIRSRDDYQLLTLMLADEVVRTGTWRHVDLSNVTVPAAPAAKMAGVKPVTVRQWVHRGRLAAAGTDGYGRLTYRLDQVLALAETTLVSTRHADPTVVAA